MTSTARRGSRLLPALGWASVASVLLGWGLILFLGKAPLPDASLGGSAGPVQAIAAQAQEWSRSLTSGMLAVGLGIGVFCVVQMGTLLTLALIHARRERTRGHLTDPYVGGVSVIVPAYNEEANIEATIASILSSDHVGELEVIVVDDGSTDGTAAILDRLDDAVTVIRQANAGKGAALNRGLEHARHPVVVMIDGDTVFEPQCVRELAAPFTDERVGAVAGVIKVARPSNLVHRWQSLEYAMSANIELRAGDVIGGITTVAGANGAFRRDALRGIGGVPLVTLAEDTDLTLTLQRAGWKVTHQSRAIAWTEAPSNLAALARQRLRWTYGTIQSLWRHITAPSDQSSGVKWLSIPYLFIQHILAPVLAPLVDLFVLLALFTLNLGLIGAVVVLAMVIHLIMYGTSLRLAGRPLRDIWVALTMGFGHRQVLYVAALRSLGHIVSGTSALWRPEKRVGAAASALRPLAVAAPRRLERV